MKNNDKSLKHNKKNIQEANDSHFRFEQRVLGYVLEGATERK